MGVITPAGAAAARSAFRDELLPETLALAARLPGYAELARHLPVEDTTGLAALPIVTKEEMLRDPPSWRDTSVPSAYVQHTGGTTGMTLPVHRTGAEVEYAARFYEQLFASTGSNGGDLPLLINLTGVSPHGFVPSSPYGGPRFDFDVLDSEWLDQAAAIFSAPWEFLDVEPCRVAVAGLEWRIRRVTNHLRRLGLDLADTPVDVVYPSGDLVTSRLRRWYETTWDARVVDRFSMTEMPGGASLCESCGQWHYDAFVIPEVVDLRTHEPIQEGIGGLVVTALYPFVQKQPFVRYWSGDVVSRSAGACAVDPVGFRYLGRIGSSVFDDDGTLLIASAMLYEILDDFPDLARADDAFPDFAEGATRTFGWLRFSLDWDASERRAELKLVASFDASYYPERAEDLRSAVRERVLEAHPALRQRTEGGLVELRVLVDPARSAGVFLPASSWT